MIFVYQILFHSPSVTIEHYKLIYNKGIGLIHSLTHVSKGIPGLIYIPDVLYIIIYKLRLGDKTSWDFGPNSALYIYRIRLEACLGIR
jgi:hypothetical protein